jgi:Tfp pilus assembly protein FimT
MKGKNQPGTFLVELMIVCAAVCVIASLSLTRTQVHQQLAVRTELQKMRVFCRFIAQRALFLGNQQSVTFDFAKQQYQADGYQEKFSDAIKCHIIPGIKGPPSDPRDYVSKPCTFENNAIVFKPDGTANAGTIYLCTNPYQQMYALTIPIGQYQYIRLYRWHAGTWELIL